MLFLFSVKDGKLSTGTELYIYLKTIRPIRTAENFEAVEWATGFSNENGCIERPVFHRLPEPNRAWLLVVYFSR